MLLENGFQITMELCYQDGPEYREAHYLVEEPCTFSVDWGHLEASVEHSFGNCLAASAGYHEEWSRASALLSMAADAIG